MSIGIETKEGLFAVMEQIAAEREAARPIVEQLVASGQPVEDIEILEGWRTAGMVIELAESSFSKLESDPLKSLSLAHLALVLTNSIPPTSYPATLARYLEGRVWKEVGFAHRYLCAYDAARHAFERAERAFSSDSALIHEEAGARYASGGILFLTGKFEEALALNTTAREVFQSIRDRRRQAMCDVMEAVVAYRRGQFDHAREKFDKILGILWDSEDLHTIGVVYNDIGHTYLALGRTSDAVTALERAREIFRHVDMPSEVNRADWGLAIVTLEHGDPVKALSMLSRLREDYLNRHMPEEAGEIGLCIVDGLVATKQIEAARRLTSKVLQEFIEAKLNFRAIGALSYLRDLLNTTDDARTEVRRVRSYVEKLRSEPAQLFLPIDEKE